MNKLLLLLFLLCCVISVNGQVSTKEVVRVTTDITDATTCVAGKIYYNATSLVNWERNNAGLCKPITSGGTPGNVVGPASAIDNHLAVFDGTTGKLIKDGGAIPSGITNAAGANVIPKSDGTNLVASDITNATTAQALIQGTTGQSPGFYSQLTGDSVPRVRVGLNTSDVASLGLGGGSGARDLFLERAGAANLRLGAPAVDTSPVAQTISVQNVLAGGTSNVAGANFTIIGSQGKGTGAGGSIIFQTAPAGSTGTSVNAPANNLSLASTGVATLNAGMTTSGVTDWLINPTTKTSGNLIDAQVNSVSKFKVDSSGEITNGTFFTTSNVALVMTANGRFTWAARSGIESSADGAINLRNANNNGFNRFAMGTTIPATIGTAPSHAQSLSFIQAEELLTIAAAPSTTTTMQVPAGAVVLSVSVRVTTVIPTAATFTVSIGSISFQTAAVSTAANTTDVGTNPINTVSVYPYIPTAAGVTITPNATPGAATGVVRVTVSYYIISPATS